MKAVFSFLCVVLALCFSANTVFAANYTDDDIKRIFYFPGKKFNGPSRFLVLEQIISAKKLECRYFGSTKTAIFDTSSIQPMKFYEDSSAFAVTQEILINIFNRQKTNLPFEYAKLNSDNTNRVAILTAYYNSIKNLTSSMAAIKKARVADPSDANSKLSDLVSQNDILENIVQKTADDGDWYLAIVLFDIYEDTFMRQLKKNFFSSKDTVAEAQKQYLERGAALKDEFAKRMEKNGRRKVAFQTLYPQARGLWSQMPPATWQDLRKYFIASMKSYIKIDRISKFFEPQEWGSAVLDVLLFIEDSPGAAALEKEFDDMINLLGQQANNP